MAVAEPHSSGRALCRPVRAAYWEFKGVTRDSLILFSNFWLHRWVIAHAEAPIGGPRGGPCGTYPVMHTVRGHEGGAAPVVIAYAADTKCGGPCRGPRGVRPGDERCARSP